jgi:hypothetical protein
LTEPSTALSSWSYMSFCHLTHLTYCRRLTYLIYQFLVTCRFPFRLFVFSCFSLLHSHIYASMRASN